MISDQLKVNGAPFAEDGPASGDKDAIMSHDDATITEDEFNRRFGVRAVHLRLSRYESEIDGDELRSREAELQFVKRYGSRHIWTLVEHKSGDLYLVSGIHPVNRVGLIASHRPRPTGVTIMVEVDDSLLNELSPV
jgi:hypothetical protein